MANLPQMQTLAQLQPKWASILNPIVANPANNSLILKNIVLTTGSNAVNHKLGRPLQGWKPVRWQGAWAQVYDTQNTNQTPQLTLELVSSAPVTIDLEVF
jgi:hypothetical protein